MCPCHRRSHSARLRPRDAERRPGKSREPAHVEVRPPVPPVLARADRSGRLLLGAGARRGRSGLRVHRRPRQDRSRRRRRGGVRHRGIQVAGRELLPVRAGCRGDDGPRRNPGGSRARRRLLATGPRRRRRHLRLVERARARQGPERPDRGDDQGDQARLSDLPVLHQLVLAVGRPRDVALALPGCRAGRAQVPAQARQAAEEPGRHEPVPATRRGGPADDAPAGRRRGGLRAPPLLPRLAAPAGARSRPARDSDLEPAADIAADRMTLARSSDAEGGTLDEAAVKHRMTLARSSGEQGGTLAGAAGEHQMTLARAAGERRPPTAMSTPGAAAGGGRPILPASRNARWFLGVWLVALGILLLNARGLIFFDTKLGVNIDPAGFYARLWHLWNPQAWLGTLQDQY